MVEPRAGSAGLLDRVAERGELDRLIARVDDDGSQVLVLRGEAGVGKTALLQHVSDASRGCAVVWSTGVESEMELAYAGLHALCAPLLDHLDALPDPQRAALSTAFGLSAGSPPERFYVGLAVLSLLAAAAAEQPLVCIVDDAQWLDQVSSQTLAFVARRLLAEPVAFVVAVRSGQGHDDVFAGFPELVVEGLPPDDARLLLDVNLPGPLDEHVRARILDETRGNPLALLQLPSALTPAELAGGFGLADGRPLTGRIEQSFVQRVEALPRDAQLLLLTAAAEPVGDVNLLWRAAERLGIGTEAAWPAEAAGLIELGARVRFPHPLVRSAVYQASDPSDRRTVRLALADSTDPVLDPDRRAWHRAHATTNPDESVAAEMVQSADRARGRGGLAAAAAFLQRAAELTPDPVARVDRSIDAAQAKLEIADPASAIELLAAAEIGPLDELQAARLERVRAEVVLATRRGRDAPALLLDAARRLDSLDEAQARATYVEAIASAMYAGRLRTGPDERTIAEAARASLPVRVESVTDQLLAGLVTRFTQGYAASAAPLRQALHTLAGLAHDDPDARWLWLACRLAQDLWDDELWHLFASRGETVARETGALGQLALALNHLAAYQVHDGSFATAAVLIDEVDAVTRATGLAPLRYAACKLAGACGDRAQMQRFTDHFLQDVAARGEGSAVGIYWGFTALLCNGFGQYAKALDAARHACEHDDVMAFGLALSELVEAAVRAGEDEEAATALDLLCNRTQAAGTPWALGVEARARALVDDQESSYLESVDQLGRSRAAFDLARSQLVYGEWLRRRSRRVDAREVLRAAHDGFSRMGADAFAERAGRELLATGETARRRTSGSTASLTSQELQVARLARAGLTNPEIGAQLFVSPRTVEYHLGKVFVKLGIKNRKDLAGALEEDPV